MKFGEAFNKHDPGAIAALYTQNAIRLESWWSEGALGQQAIEKSYADMLASMPGEFVGQVVQVYAIGNDMCVITKDSEERYGRVTKHGSAIVTPILGRSAWNTLIDRLRSTKFRREETMKIRAVVILVGLAISFALPIFAQEKEDVKAFPFTPIPAGPQLVQQIEAINQKFDEAFNKARRSRCR